MHDREEKGKKEIEVNYTSDHAPGTLVLKGVIRNKGDHAVRLVELKALYKNMDGFVMDVETMSLEEIILPGEERGFSFPQRPMPPNCYREEVVVSKFVLRSE